ncbi:MAG: hypothetical protein HQK83_01170 [Fibrobacteria bacterium]|nr:hypothetical protein [Fibrobacteria bacterium]
MLYYWHMNWKAIVMVIVFALVPLLWAEDTFSSSPNTLLTQNRPFSREMMQDPKYLPGQASFSLLDPSRFNMSQSYSTTMSYGGGSSHSYGMYLNTISYQLFNPLVLSVDLGLYTPFFSTGSYSQSSAWSQQNKLANFVLPRVSLDYKPTKNTHISLHYINMNDACKAYGCYYNSPYRF